MGIEHFQKWLRENHPQCFILNNDEQFDNVYFDLNFLLHNAIYNTKGETGLLGKLFAMVNHFLDITQPSKTVTFATDGPAPYAKIILQRKRRLQMSRNTDLTKINPLYFTPGTTFMINLNNHIQNFISKNTNKKLLFDTDLDGNDEAEIKIIRYIIKNNKKNKTDSHLIIGNDADLIVIAMALNIENLYIMLRDKKDNPIISIDKLADIMISKYGYSKNFRQVFAVLSLLNGNDYFPKLSFIKENQLWNIYEHVKDNYSEPLITENGLFNMAFLKDFLRRTVYSIKPQFNKKFNFSTFNPMAMHLYLEGLLWCLNMYKTGICSKYDYIYNYGSPQPLELLYYLEICEPTITIPISNTKCIDNIFYTLIVLPLKAKHLIPEKYHTLMNNELKFLYEIEECQKCTKLHTKLSRASKKLKKLQSSDTNKEEDTTDIRKKLSTIHCEMKKHKSSHKTDISAKDIDEIITICKKSDNIKS